MPSTGCRGQYPPRQTDLVPVEGLPPLAAFAGTVVPRPWAQASMGMAGALRRGKGTGCREPCLPQQMLIACNGESGISSDP